MSAMMVFATTSYMIPFVYAAEQRRQGWCGKGDNAGGITIGSGSGSGSGSSSPPPKNPPPKP